MLNPIFFMRCSQACGALISLSLLMGSLFTGTAEAAATTIPPIPVFSALPLPEDQTMSVLPTGELSWLGLRYIERASSGSTPSSEDWELAITRWNPASGRTTQVPFEPTVTGSVYSQIALSTGLLALATIGPRDAKRWSFLFVPNNGSSVVKVETNEVFDPRQTSLLSLGNDVAVLVTRDTDKRYIKVFTVERIKNSLHVAAMPVLPIAYRRDFASAVAGRDQVMILGGSDGPYRGCWSCRAETHVLDLRTRTWRDGPPMLEARSELAASTLPDGSIVVTGGWTKAADWSNGASRTTERWNPTKNRFESLPPMPTGTALHKHVLWDAPWGQTLLVVQGIVGAAHALDFSTWTWRTVGEWDKDSIEGGCGFYPFVVDGNAYAWSLYREEGAYSNRSCEDQKYARLSLIKPPTGASLSTEAPPESFLISYRHGAFLPAKGEAPALVVGGFQHAGANRNDISSAVESIGRDGRVATLPSLLTARKNARAFRAAGGVLVVGGEGPDGPLGREPNSAPLTAEWLAPAGSTPWRWQEVSGNGPSPSAAVAELRDGSLLALDPTGNLRQFKIVLRDGKPTFDSRAWPSLNRERRSLYDDGQSMRIQELNDGRVVVAGGSVRSERIALYSAKALRAGQDDEYVDIGYFLPWRRYEIFDPASQRWINSAPAVEAGGRAVVLGNGRVIKAAPVPKDAEDSGPQRFVVETSNPAGTAWAPLSSKGSRLKITDKYELFTIDDELFASGEVEGLNTKIGPGAIEWLNPATGIWEQLWLAQQEDNEYGYWGRILRRTLVGTSGQSKTVLIPIRGL